MLRPERWMEREDEEIIYSDEEPNQNDSKSEEDEDEWELNWDDMECVDEYGDDGENRNTHILKMMSEEESSEEEFDDLELDAVDELNDTPATTNELNEKKNGNRIEDEKNESDEEKEKEGDPWSRWVGMEKEDEEKKERERERRTKKMESKRDNMEPTLAELVLKGKVSGGEARRDKKSKGITGRNIPRRMSPLMRRVESPSRRNDCISRKMRTPSPLLKREKMRSTIREGRRISPSNDMKRDRSSRRNPSPSNERRRNESPMRKERRHSPTSSIRREKRSFDRKEETRRMDRLPERRKEGGREDVSLIPSTYRETMRIERRERSPLPLRRDVIPRLRSPNRKRRSRSPMMVKRDTRVSSPNRMRLGEKCTRIEDVRRDRSRSPLLSNRKELLSLLNVKIHSPPRMEGRVKRDERIEKRREEIPKERIEKKKDERDGRENKKEIEKKKEKEVNEKKDEEKKRHIPIVWNDKETDAKKMHRSVGHMEGIECIARKNKEEERIEWNKREDTIGSASIPLSMIGRVGRVSLHDMTEKPRATVVPPKYEINDKKSLESVSSRAIPSKQREQVTKRSIDSVHNRPQPMELVRTIMNNDATIEIAEEVQPIKKRNVKYEEKGSRMEEKDGEDEGCWLSPNLMKFQEKINEFPLDIMDKKADHSSAALRLFDRATASAVSSSTMKDTRHPITKEVHRRIDAPDEFKEKKGRKKKAFNSQRRMEERIEIRPPQEVNGNARRKHNSKFGGNEKVSQSDHPRLLEIYY